jgi:Clp amino terminal domain, pathogenicity island component
MFGQWDEEARTVVVLAQEEARGLRHHRIGSAHLLLGVVRVAPSLIEVEVERVRGAVVAAVGRGVTASPDVLPYSGRATAVLEALAAEVRSGVLTVVTPGDVLRALRRSGGTAADVLARFGAGATAEQEPLRIAADDARWAGPAPADVARRLSQGAEVVVRFDDAALGDLGNPRVDGRMLLAILLAGGRAARLLRDRGVDEAAVRAALPGLDERP